jgi:molybdopterin/thiamine biosynthesis adenylyltransferase
MHDRIRSEATTMDDPAGRRVEILKDEQALLIARDESVSIGQVYIHALMLGICPYRYVRNREAISIKEQLVLAQSRVAVVGAGGLGGQVILLLARAGVGNLTVIDYDRFDETNLNRQALCNMDMIGEFKSEAAVATIGRINPGVNILARSQKVDAENAEEILAGSDVVVDALDNVGDRFVIEKAAQNLGIPLVHGALAGFEGQLMTIFPDDPGLQDLYGKGYSEKDKTKSAEAIFGVPALTPAFIATLQAMEVLKIILNRPGIFRNAMLHADLENGALEKFRFESPD